MLTADLECALKLADVADSITTERFQSQDLQVSSKPDRTPVTDADTAVEDTIREALRQRQPSDGVMGEERGGTSDEGRVWVIDPIDGTKNFLRGGPAWGSLIALVEDDRPVVGVVTAPALKTRWWAARGEGAWAQSADSEEPRLLSVSSIAALSDSYISTTDLHAWAEHHSRDAYLQLVDTCWESRGFGDFWQHCLVAEGVLDVAAEPLVYPWDVAAVQVLVEEAGGALTDLEGVAHYRVASALSSNGQVHRQVLSTLNPRHAGPNPTHAQAKAREDELMTDP